jgi:hypothetical protein
MPRITEMSRFDIVSNADDRLIAMGDNAVWYALTAPVEDTCYGVAITGASKGLIVRVTRTGSRLDSHGNVRVRIDFPRDCERADDYCAFGDAGSVGGIAHASRFVWSLV